MLLLGKRKNLLKFKQFEISEEPRKYFVELKIQKRWSYDLQQFGYWNGFLRKKIVD